MEGHHQPGAEKETTLGVVESTQESMPVSGGKTGMMGGLEGKGPKAGRAPHMIQMLENPDLSPEQRRQVRSLARGKLDKMADLWAKRMKMGIELAVLE